VLGVRLRAGRAVAEVPEVAQHLEVRIAGIAARGARWRVIHPTRWRAPRRPSVCYRADSAPR
jgi:hypothetical protein